MKPPLLILICLLILVGCTSCSNNGTHLYSPSTGKKLADFTADMEDSDYRSADVSWTVKKHYPSKTIAARGTAITKVVRGTGSAVGVGAKTFLTPGL